MFDWYYIIVFVCTVGELWSWGMGKNRKNLQGQLESQWLAVSER